MGNGSSFGLLVGMRMGIVLMGMGLVAFIGKKIKFLSLSTSIVNSLLFYAYALTV